MEWYQGSIVDAVSQSKKAGALFVVYVEGEDEKSKKITGFIDKEEVSNRLKTKNFVAIKVQANSVPHQQFAEIYKDVSVPSIFFIGKSGLPAEVIKDVDNSQELATKIDAVLLKCGFDIPSQKGAAQQTEKLLESEQKSVPPPNVVCENGVCRIQPSPSTSKAEPDKPKEEAKPVNEAKPEPAEKELTPEEKVERAKELIEKQRLLKLKEEEAKEKLKEIERRKMGQDVQQLKKWQEDQELKQLKEEREKEKRENKAARDRVLAQIAQDKAERAAKFSTSPPIKSSHSQPSPSQPTARRPVDNTHARLQFKMPDGSTHTHEFSAEDTLENVRSYVTTNLNVSADFTLATAFPRHEFNSSDSTQTLLDLQLVPNALILVLRPTSSAITTATSGGFSGIMWMLFAPFVGIFSYIKGLIFGRPRTPSPEPVKRHAPQDDEPQTSYQMKRMRESTVIRRQGNIARLSDRNDSDDENNTWNGNSTQQM